MSIEAKSMGELLKKLRKLREEDDPIYSDFSEKLETKKRTSRNRNRSTVISMEPRPSGSGTYSHGESRTENCDFHLEAVDCPRCGRRGNLRAHYGRQVGAGEWYGPYFGVIHQKPFEFCYFGRYYPDVINTTVPEPDM